MFIYISFPVGIFHYVNQPAYYDKYVVEAKKQYFPPESKSAHEQMEKFIEDFNASADKKYWDALERQSRN